MKKLLSLVLAFMLCMIAISSMAEEVVEEATEEPVVFTTMQQVLDVAEDTGLNAGTDEYAGIVVKLNDQYYRVVATLDDQARELLEKARDPELMDKWEAFQRKADDYIKENLPITIEKITAEPKSKEELSSYVRKSLTELQAEHFEWWDGELLHGPASAVAVLRVTCDMFIYDLTLNMTRGKCEGYMEKLGMDSIADFTVNAIEYTGQLSWHAADKEYAADGSSVPDQLWFGDVNVLAKLEDILKEKGFSGQTVDDLVNALSEISEEEYLNISPNAESVDPEALFEYLEQRREREFGEPEAPPAKPQR